MKIMLFKSLIAPRRQSVRERLSKLRKRKNIRRSQESIGNICNVREQKKTVKMIYTWGLAIMAQVTEAVYKIKKCIWSVYDTFGYVWDIFNVISIVLNVMYIIVVE